MKASTAHCLLVLIVACAASASAWGQDYPWQQPHAQVLPHGDLEWTPQPFTFVAGDSVRYIDHEGGNDAADGTTRESAWKHHPWDAAATGRAAAASGAHTYVFKRGVTYRGALVADDEGTADSPIRLTSDPSWGEGEAVLAGSRVVESLSPVRDTSRFDSVPRGRLYSAELAFSPRNVWIVPEDGTTQRLPLARTPNWTIDNWDDIKSGWWTWKNTGEGMRHYGNKMQVGQTEANFATDPEHLTGDLSELEGAYLWTEYGWVMGTPYPSRVVGSDADKHGLAFGGQWGAAGGSTHIVAGNRYYLEDKPQFLDDPTGEFWFEKQGPGGTLYVILPEGVGPDEVRIEAAEHRTLINAESLRHVEISGLTFRFTNVQWQLDAIPGPNADNPACIRVDGQAEGVIVRNCRFEDVNTAVYMRAGGDRRVEDVTISDNDVLRTDHAAFWFSDNVPWGLPEGEFGEVENVSILRNRVREVGRRPSRYGQGHAVELQNTLSAHLAGNILDRTWAAGLFVFGGKGQTTQDVPWTRILIHHNKVTNSLLNSNDWGGIETWQGGPAYVFNNISGNPGGYWNYNFTPGHERGHANARFGFAFYLDGAFKNFHFNNIAFGKSDELNSPLTSTAAFQEIHSYQNTFFNNTADRFLVGSRRQAPAGGRDKFLGNVFQHIGWRVFRHADPAASEAEANAEHAGEQGEAFAYDTNAYGSNLFHEVNMLGVYDATGAWLRTLEEFQKAVQQRQAIRGDVGEAVEEPPVPNADAHDFSPSSVADGHGVKVFVPWALYRTVGEWHFYRSGKDGRVIDEHWDMPPYFVDREVYHDLPMFPLAPHGVDDGDFVEGPLEDWTRGALQLDGQSQYLTLADDQLGGPVEYAVRFRAGEKAGTTKQRTATGRDVADPEIYDGNFLIEVYLRPDAAGRSGVVIEKMNDAAGFALRLADGRPQFVANHGGREWIAVAPEALSAGEWHHLVAECDRSANTLVLYIDGERVIEADGPGDADLSNGGDLHVGGTPDGQCLPITLEFLRLSHGTLADARTDIDELCAWQFGGPFLRDFTGREPTGTGRDAGAVEGP